MPLPPSRADQTEMIDQADVDNMGKKYELPQRWDIYVGIDPGKNGGIVAIINGEPVLHAMPDTPAEVWGIIEALSPVTLAGEVQGPGSVFCVLEQVAAMPGQGVSSMFTFGKGFGGLIMALTAADIPFETAQPQRWMKALGIPSRKKAVKKGKKIIKAAETDSKYKKRLREVAQRLFPSVKGITSKTADALLIAEYCRRNRLGA